MLSTPIMKTVTGVAIVDFKSMIDVYRRYYKMYELYKVFPIRDIVSLALCRSYDNDIIEILDNEIQLRLDMINCEIDFNLCGIFVWDILDELELQLMHQFPKDVDYNEYIFDRWVGETTAVLVKTY